MLLSVVVMEGVILDERDAYLLIHDTRMLRYAQAREIRWRSV